MDNKLKKLHHKTETDCEECGERVGNSPFYHSMEELLRKKLKRYIKKLDGLEQGNLYSIVLKCMEKPLIELVLEETGWSQKKASTILGINRNTLRKKIREYKLRNETKK